MNKNDILQYLQLKKEFFRKTYGITTLGLYGSYARDEATDDSDVDIFYERDNNFELKRGLEFMFLDEKIANDLRVKYVDFVKLDSMQPLVKYLAKGDFIYV